MLDVDGAHVYFTMRLWGSVMMMSLTSYTGYLAIHALRSCL